MNKVTTLHTGLTMDVARNITRVKSARFNDTIILYHSVRQVGFVYKFNLKRGNKYRCCRCKELGKEHTLTVPPFKPVHPAHSVACCPRPHHSIPHNAFLLKGCFPARRDTILPPRCTLHTRGWKTYIPEWLHSVSWQCLGHARVPLVQRQSR